MGSSLKVKSNGNGASAPERAFSEGVLVHVEIRMWGATARLDSTVLGQLGINDKDLLDEIHAVRGLLTDEGNDLLNQYRTLRNEVRGWLGRNSIPFPIDGFCFLPKAMIERADAYLKQRQEEAQMIVDTFVPKVKALEAAYAKKFPALYDRTKYPSEARLRQMFEFRWTFRIFAPPDERLGVLTPAIYKEEVERFKQDIGRMREMTVNAVGNALLSRVAQLSKQCENDAVRSNTVESVKTFLEKFDTLFQGFVEEKRLVALVNEVKSYMDGTDAAMLSADDGFRAVVGAKMSEVVTEIQAVPGIQLKRGFEL